LGNKSVWNTQNHVDLAQTLEDDLIRVVNRVVKDHTLAEDLAANVHIHVVNVHILVVVLLPIADHIPEEGHILAEGLTETDPILIEGIIESVIIVTKSVILVDIVKKKGKRILLESVLNVANLDIR
jgi:hypothetical protein